MKRILLSALVAASLPGALMPASAAPGAEDRSNPYFCGKSFTLFVMRDETVSQSKERGGVFVLSTSGRDYAFSEGDFELPSGAKPVRNDNGVKVYTVSKGGKLIGYTISVDERRPEVLVLSRSFKGNTQDLDVLSRFNFHPNRSGGCQTAER